MEEQMEEPMLRRVIFLPHGLHTRAEHFLKRQGATGSLMRLPELVRVALHQYLYYHENRDRGGQTDAK